MPTTPKPRQPVKNNNGFLSSFTANQRYDLIKNALLSRDSIIRSAMERQRDIDQSCQYPDSISFQDYYKMYARGPGKRVVALFPKECWKSHPWVYEDEDPDVETAFEKAYEELANQFNFCHFLQRIDELSGIGSFGVLLLGIDDGQDLSKPIEGIGTDGLSAELRRLRDQETTETPNAPASKTTPPKAKRKLLYLRALHQGSVEIEKLDTDPNSPRHGQPVSYKINFQNLQEGVLEKEEITSTSVHWTRVIHVADNREQSEIFGVPREHPVYNNLLDLKKVGGGSAEMFWSGAFPGFAFTIDPNIAATDPEFDRDAMKEEIKNWQNDLQRVLALIGVGVQSLAPQVADPTATILAQWQQIAVILDVPMRILLGSERGELASSQDQEKWNGTVKHRQETYLGPMLVRPFVERLMAIGVLPTIAKPVIEWPDLYDPSPDEKASRAQKVADALSKYASGGVGEIFPLVEFLTLVLGFTKEEAQAIEKAAEDQVAATADPEGDSLAHRIAGPPPAAEADAAHQRSMETIDAQTKAQIQVAKAKPQPKAPVRRR